MIQSLNHNYTKIIKKFPQQAWKIALYLILAITWSLIFVGTYLLLK